MATKSFTTDYKFNAKSSQKLVDAMEKSEYRKVNRPHVYARRVNDSRELQSFLGKIKTKWVLK